MKLTFTKGPWRWQTFGRLGWALVGAWGITPIILDWGRLGVGKKFQLRCRDGGIMTAFNPEHPDSMLIVAAPDLLVACEAALRAIRDEASYKDHNPRERQALSKLDDDLVAAIVKATGVAP